MKIIKVNPIVQWWMTPKLPPEDIYGLPLLKSKSVSAKYAHLFSQWLVHPIKRRLAKRHLENLRKDSKIKVIGITGSAGKSTTTKLLDCVLKLDGPTVTTPHSIDPVYNIPNTILRADSRTKYLILEMSVEYPGEMDYYLWLGIPDIGVILNIYPSHLANLGDVKGVFAEKSKLVVNLSKAGTAVLNLNDKFLKGLDKKINPKIKWFKGSEDPMLSNIKAVEAIARALGISDKVVTKGIRDFQTPSHRLQLIELSNGIKVFDDTYNSNPKAAIAALNYFKKIAKGRKVAVIGDMLELGKYEKEGHIKLGEEMSQMGFEYIIGVGKAIGHTLNTINKKSRSTKTKLTSNSAEAFEELKNVLGKNVSVFVKGSRSIGLDKTVSDLVDHYKHS